MAKVLSDPDLLRKLDPKILRHVLINSAQIRPEHSAKQLLSPPLQRLPPPELPVFPARLPQVDRKRIADKTEQVDNLLHETYAGRPWIQLPERFPSLW